MCSRPWRARSTPRWRCLRQRFRRRSGRSRVRGPRVGDEQAGRNRDRHDAAVAAVWSSTSAAAAATPTARRNRASSVAIATVQRVSKQVAGVSSLVAWPIGSHKLAPDPTEDGRDPFLAVGGWNSSTMASPRRRGRRVCRTARAPPRRWCGRRGRTVARRGQQPEARRAGGTPRRAPARLPCPGLDYVSRSPTCRRRRRVRPPRLGQAVKMPAMCSGSWASSARSPAVSRSGCRAGAHTGPVVLESRGPIWRESDRDQWRLARGYGAAFRTRS